MTFSLLKVSFLVVTFIVVVVGTLVTNYAHYLPVFVKKSFLYGKFGYKGKGKAIQVPKRWFQHFYIFASIWSLLFLILMCFVYLYLGRAPDDISKVLDLVGGSNRKVTVQSVDALLAMLLLTVQSWKRLYETYFVSVFSDTKIDISQYFIGFYHYFGAVLAILVEATGFCHDSINENSSLKVKDLTIAHLIISFIFLLASWQQLVAARTLGNLRKNKKGDVVTLKHKIPRGGLFEFISSPHLTCEIIMYLCLALLLQGNITWYCVTFWVLSNQVVTGVLAHKWYQSSFSDYPSQRRALIPFIF